MAIIRYKSFDMTVQTIADRNAITNRVDHMTVLVRDAISDPDAGTGKATYRWSATDSLWILISSSTHLTISFNTEELTIANGSVTPANVPTDYKIWDVRIIENDVIVAEIRASELIVNATSINGLDEYNGKTIRFTYAYGTITQQMSSAIDELREELTQSIQGSISSDVDCGSASSVIDSIDFGNAATI